MKLKRAICILAVCVFTLGLAVSANAGWWIGVGGGPSFGTTQDINVSTPFANNTIYNAKIRTGFTTGIIGGYDFNDPKQFPEWARFFGVTMDVGYTQMNFSAQTRAVATGQNIGFANVDGGNTALTFMLVGRLPLMITSDYPNGRFQPYLGVGPGVVFSSMDFNNYGGSTVTSTNVALVTEAGIRYMVTPNFSASLAYRYRYLPSSQEVSLPGVGNVNLAGTQNTSQALLRVAYHF